ncbi:hypothetical protein EDEG_01113 [Edhazardia aedis USNM 41457]|uniref:Uncharacterized protein n=1 Tax=Edhazardia aedis (strain USNM 41457) TaxID=1003232 RepID=J9DQ72_EDHAE|nr:hypothetical protein EDEG_01113 [Edhazardia aedis USNM 41457]|eukprot:EJW04700.1 hypothetical protein EDEG_01113 [Edhazardia aedis USNM 41457]
MKVKKYLFSFIKGNRFLEVDNIKKINRDQARVSAVIKNKYIRLPYRKVIIMLFIFCQFCVIKPTVLENRFFIDYNAFFRYQPKSFWLYFQYKIVALYINTKKFLIKLYLETEILAK